MDQKHISLHTFTNKNIIQTRLNIMQTKRRKKEMIAQLCVLLFFLISLWMGFGVRIQKSASKHVKPYDILVLQKVKPNIYGQLVYTKKGEILVYQYQEVKQTIPKLVCLNEKDEFVYKEKKDLSGVIRLVLRRKPKVVE